MKLRQKTLDQQKMWTNQKMTAIFVDRPVVASALYTSWKKLVLLI